MSNDIEFQVTSEHLETALARGDNYDAITECLVATAAAATFPGQKVECGFVSLQVGQTVYTLDKDAVGIIYEFTSGHIDAIREKLPFTIKGIFDYSVV